MLSQLGPLFKTVFRQAESNDTRQKIPHEERDNPSKNKEEAEEKIDDESLWQDSTTVSINALKNFLINFLATMPESEIKDQPIQPIQNTLSQRPKEQKRPTNTHNAKAVRAYQSIAAHTTSQQNQTVPEGNGPKYRKPPSVDQIENKELRDIYQLIDQLDILSGRGIQDITIEKSGNFVESLKASVERLI